MFPQINYYILNVSALPEMIISHTVEVGNKFKGLDLIDRVPGELWTEVQETGIKTIPMEEMQKKQEGCLRRPYK